MCTNSWGLLLIFNRLNSLFKPKRPLWKDPKSYFTNKFTNALQINSVKSTLNSSKPLPHGLGF